MGPKSGLRTRLFRAIHAEAPKRGFDHDGLHDMCVREYRVHSMSEMTEQQLMSLYKGWTGKGLKSRAKLPKRGEAAAGAIAEIVSGEDLVRLGEEFAKRGMGPEGQRNFVARQLRGRVEIRSRRDFARVFNGVRAMNRREAK
jgi:hypothetical protein